MHAAYFGVGALEALRVGFRTAAEKSAYLDELLSLAGAGPRARNQASR